jgi:hypothetical protein
VEFIVKPNDGIDAIKLRMSIKQVKVSLAALSPSRRHQIKLALKIPLKQ